MSEQDCECKNWAEVDMRVQMLTGHHSRCALGCQPIDAAFRLLKELTRGIECWAHEEDGEVYADCWQAYRKAKAIEGVYLPDENRPLPGTERGTSDPDAAAAREYVKSATINNVEAGVYELDALLLRLADKVEGKR